MGGMYPDNQTITLFGETITWPGVDPNTGKFTNGDFSDPLKRPSYIPAESLNLILDNLTNLINSLGGSANNTEAGQLERVFTEMFSLKANLGSPAFTGTPTAPEITTIPLPRNANTNALNNWGNQIVTMNTLRNAIVQRLFPTGTYYTQYPVTGQSTLTGMFPDNKAPAVLFGGTWTIRFEGEEVFFKIASSTIEANRGKAYRTAQQDWGGTGIIGIEEDAIRKIMGTLRQQGNRAGISEASGAFYESPTRTSHAGEAAGGSVPEYMYLDTGRTVPVDSRNRPRNRLIRVYEKTA